VVLSDGAAVLNAADPRVAGLARLCDGSVILYALDGRTPGIDAQRAAGGRTVFLRDGACVLAEGGSETLLPHLQPLAASAPAPEALLAAVAAAWAMGIDPELIAAGVQTFGPATVRSTVQRAPIEDRKND
jgi:cyanophycin synthetase